MEELLQPVKFLSQLTYCGHEKQNVLKNLNNNILKNLIFLMIIKSLYKF